jgi:hypothetical protein
MSDASLLPLRQAGSADRVHQGLLPISRRTERTWSSRPGHKAGSPRLGSRQQECQTSAANSKAISLPAVSMLSSNPHMEHLSSRIFSRDPKTVIVQLRRVLLEKDRLGHFGNKVAVEADRRDTLRWRAMTAVSLRSSRRRVHGCLTFARATTAFYLRLVRDAVPRLRAILSVTPLHLRRAPPLIE